MDQDALDAAARLNAILESAVDGIVTISSVGTIESVNAAAVQIFGYEREELIGENVRCLMPLELSQLHDTYISNYVRTGEAKIVGIGREVTGQRKDGTEFPLYLAVSEGFHQGSRIFTGIVRDLSALRLAEARAKSAEQLASLSLITAGIAHDIGTPMNVILGYAEMLRDTLTEPKDKRRAEVIADQVRRVTDLLQTLLNIARPRHAIRSDLHLEQILDHALEFFQEKLRARGIDVDRDYQAVPEINGDRDRLEQMFLNLIVNAADAMSNGGKLSVRVSTVEGASGDEILVELEDTGHGMDEKTLSQIFDPFYSTKDRGKGTGLGLVVAKTIVSDHDGTIECESELGKGSRFLIRFPVGRVAVS